MFETQELTKFHSLFHFLDVGSLSTLSFSHLGTMTLAPPCSKTSGFGEVQVVCR